MQDETLPVDLIDMDKVHSDDLMEMRVHMFIIFVLLNPTECSYEILASDRMRKTLPLSEDIIDDVTTREQNYDSVHKLSAFKTPPLKSKFASLLEILKEIVNSLPSTRYCQIVQQIASFSRETIPVVMSSLLNNNTILKNVNAGQQQKPERPDCRRTLKHVPIYMKKNDLLEATYLELIKFYNSLPLAFQCHTLYRVAISRQNGRRKSRKERSRGVPLTGGKIHLMDFREMQESSEANVLIGWVVQSTETNLRSYVEDLMPVAKQCGKAFLGAPSYTETVRFAVLSSRVEIVTLAKRNLRRELPRLLRKYTVDTRFPKRRQSKVQVQWSKRRQQSYAVEIVRTQPVPPGRTNLYVHIRTGHYSSESRALSANRVLAAIYNFGADRFRRLIVDSRVKMKFRAIDKPQPKRTRASPKRQFPSYMTSYFHGLSKKQKCYIFRTISAHSNSSFDSTIHSIASVRNIDTSAHPCLTNATVTRKNERDSEHRFTKNNVATIDYVDHLDEPSSSNTIVQQPKRTPDRDIPQKIVEIPRATVVEISMLVALALLFVSMVTFCAISFIFIHRKQKVKESLLRIAQKQRLDEEREYYQIQISRPLPVERRKKRREKENNRKKRNLHQRQELSPSGGDAKCPRKMNESETNIDRQNEHESRRSSQYRSSHRVRRTNRQRRSKAQKDDIKESDCTEKLDELRIRATSSIEFIAYGCLDAAHESSKLDKKVASNGSKQRKVEQRYATGNISKAMCDDDPSPLVTRKKYPRANCRKDKYGGPSNDLQHSVGNKSESMTKKRTCNERSGKTKQLKLGDPIDVMAEDRDSESDKDVRSLPAPSSTRLVNGRRSDKRNREKRRAREDGSTVTDMALLRRTELKYKRRIKKNNFVECARPIPSTEDIKVS